MVTAPVNPPLASDRFSGTPPLTVERCSQEDRSLLLAWAHAHGLDSASALDVSQEVFVRLLAAPPTFPSRGAQIAWLRRVTSNLCIDILRSKCHSPLGTHLGAPAAPGSISEEEQRALRGAVGDLTEMQRLVLFAKAVEQATFASIAHDLEISVPTAKTHYRRAIESLRLHLRSASDQPEQQT